MLTEDEKRFLAYWESVREEEARFGRKLRKGLPVAMLFGMPILLSVAAVYIFSPEWYTKIAKSVNQVTLTVMIAVFIFMFFFAFTRMHFKWEMNDQLYQELKEKQKHERMPDDAANQQ